MGAGRRRHQFDACRVDHGTPAIWSTAALAGFDRGETVTIPPLADVAQWDALQTARLSMAPNLSRREVAPRYRDALAA